MVDQLVARLDEQTNETSDLRAHYQVLNGKLERAQAENSRLTEKMRAQQHQVRDVERHVSERAQDMSELMSQIGNVVHVQGQELLAPVCLLYQYSHSLQPLVCLRVFRV